MSKNKIKNVLALGLMSSALLLAGCDKVEAKLPTNNPILDFGDEAGSVYNNTEKQIYEALVTSGDTNSEKTLNNVLYIYSQSVFGPFFGEDGLKAVATSGDDAKLDAYVNTYSTFQVKENGELNKEASRARVKSFYNEVLYRINEVFFGYVKDSTYQERNEFIEEKFYKAQIKNYYHLPTKLDDGAPYKSEAVLVDGSYRLDEENAAEDTLLNKFFKDIFAVYQEYIEINVLPDIYRKELTAQYLIDENYSSTIKNVAARKVDYITLPAGENNNVNRLLIAYNDIVIKEGKYDLTFLDRLYKGVDQALYSTETEEGAIAEQVYKKANWTLSSIDLDGDGNEDYKYYIESQFGDICEKFKVIQNSATRYDPNFETQWNSFTSNGTYSAKTGFEIQRRELVAKNETTNGWYTPGGLSSLPENLRNRIFKTQVANQLVPGAENSKYDYLQQEGGRYYLIPKDPLSTDKHPYIVKDGTNFVIVEVKEAVKSSRLDESKDDFYGLDKAYRIAHKIAYSLASSDTWVKAAKSYYVEKMSIIYHDEYVLDYFKTTFPDLFD